MDEALSRHAFDNAVARLKRLAGAGIGIGQVAVTGRTILATITSRHGGRKYRLRIECGEAFPAKPPDCRFVNPETGTDDDALHWPDDGQQFFKTNEHPRWICIRGTAAYSSRHTECRYDPGRDTVNQTTFHITRRING